MIENLPEKFVRLITESHGAKGTRWLNNLPSIIEKLEEDWKIKVGEPFANLSYHLVAPCILADGGEAVLKICYSGDEKPPIYDEAAMLRIYDGNGAVEFLRIESRLLAMLLEKLEPGKTLIDTFSGDEAAAVEIAIEVLRKIRIKLPERHYFVQLSDWFAELEEAQGTEFPAAAVEKARRFYKELSAAEVFLIHGDFHHENILSATREPFLAIDPKGIAGQIGYDISVFLNNHVWWLENDANLRGKLYYAAARFAEEFEIDANDLRKWAYAQAILSAWWTFQENGENWKTNLALAEVWEV